MEDVLLTEAQAALLTPIQREEYVTREIRRHPEVLPDSPAYSEDYLERRDAHRQKIALVCDAAKREAVSFAWAKIEDAREAGYITRTEYEILTFCFRGYKPSQIAEALGVHRNTAAKYLRESIIAMRRAIIQLDAEVPGRPNVGTVSVLSEMFDLPSEVITAALQGEDVLPLSNWARIWQELSAARGL